MDPRLILPLPPDSPWAAWARPDIRHCEANLPGWIAAPADAWSNLAYLAVGAGLLARGRGAGRALGAIALAVGLASFAFHASYTAAGQALDYLGMYLLAGWLIARGRPRAWAELVAASLLAYALFARLRWPVQTTMIALFAAAAFVEARGRPRAPRLAAFGLLLLAYVCWHLDHTDAFCRPDDHVFQWHAVWHALTAAAFVPLARAHAVLE